MRNKKLIVLLSIVAALIMVIIASGATFLVRHVEAYNYYGYADGENYDAMVVDAAKIKKNTSMFFVDEGDVKRRVESAYFNVGVVNVERKFPDRVCVNYVVYERMFQYATSGRYYYCYASGRVGGSSADKMNDVFTVKPKGSVTTDVGEYFQPTGGSDRAVINKLVDYMHRHGLVDRQICSNIDFIDLTRDGYVYIRLRAGCSIELHGDVDDFTELFDRGWSIYFDDETDITRVSGLIRVWKFKAADGEPVRSSYTKVGAEIGKAEDGSTIFYSDEGYYADNYGRR